MRLLLVEDDPDLGQAIREGLITYGYTVDWLTCGKEAKFALTQTQEAFDLIIMDLGLPHVSGLEIIKAVRMKQDNTPIIVLTAKDSNADVITGLNDGADDYLTKPFDFAILHSRIAALLRRSSKNPADHTLTIGDVSINPLSHSVMVKGKSVPFSRQEFKILHRLMESQGHVISREKITQLLYGWGDDVDSNTIEVHMHNIRKKLNLALKIRTIRGVGYIIEA